MTNDYCLRCGSQLKNGACPNEKCPMVGKPIHAKNEDLTIPQRWDKIRDLSKDAHNPQTRITLYGLISDQASALQSNLEKLEDLKKQLPESNREQSIKVIDEAIADNDNQSERLENLLNVLRDIETKANIKFMKEFKQRLEVTK